MPHFLSPFSTDDRPAYLEQFLFIVDIFPKNNLSHKKRL